MTDIEDKDKIVEVEEGQEEISVDIVDDTPEEDRKHKARPEGAEPDIPADEEIQSYSEAVQKRIKKLRFEFHEERRAKEAAQRQLEEAVKLAQNAITTNESLRNRYNSGHKVLVEQAKGRIESELARAKAVIKQAFESGDAEKLAEAQEVIGRLSAEKVDVENYRPAEIPKFQAPEMPAPMPDARTRDWAQKNNDWFMKDRNMTNYAFVLDERLKTEGIEPGSDEYFKNLDAGLRREFPGKFKVSSDADQVSQPRKQGNVVAPASRTQATAPRKITLTKSQVALAHRLGISPEGYAKQLAKINGET